MKEPKAGKNEDKPIEKIYQKKTQLEHILLRPDAYIGSDEMQKDKLWVYNTAQEKLEFREVNFVPGLFKIFDEILVNAADNYQRDPKSMTYIKVTIDQANNKISVRNNGKGIPVENHKEYNMFVPELIFGHLLTSSNYNDEEKKVTGGRNGYGAKLTNIFSKEFIVETADLTKKRYFKQIFKNNMSSRSNPEIKENYTKEEFTCITFQPDLSKFKMDHLDDDMVALMTKRVYDMAGVTPSQIKVYLNEKKLEVKNFSSYIDMYLKSGADEERELPKVYENPHERWEVAVSLSDGQFQQVSYVNSISTSKGGTHVNYVTEKITDHVLEAIKKKHKNLNIKGHNVKQHLWVFVNCLIENPSFDSQTKENMTLKASSFGSSFNLSEKFLKDVIKTGIVDHCVSYAKTREELKMTKQLNAGGKKQGRLLGIPKLDDANNAGTKKSADCTLILTEGDSAKSLAMAGVEIVGRDNFGVFPLRGKLLNVREASNIQITNNEEIQNLIKILGLQVGKSYEEIKSLRYGSLMIMTDQDHDGSHIKGLIINFIHHFWPSLIKLNGFMKEFITPIIKVTKGNQVLSFYTIPEYKKWVDSLGGNVKNWNIKYYKGLGTSTQKEAQEYFAQIQKNKIDFVYQDERDDESIDLVFNKKKAEDRKNWLANFDINNTLQDSLYTHLSYEDFINKEFILFSMADNERSIPSVCDGLKPSERKILYSCFKKKLKGEIKVAQLTGYVSEHSAYHHGEQSLASTIVAMAQNFVGSNNINLLMPIGMFGTRNLGGKDSASARYIFTSLSKVTRHIFNENDDPLMDFIVEEGQKIEPHWYLPTLPMILVNGTEGIGSGWSTNIPCYNPRTIIENLISKIKTGSFFEMTPWYKGFQGTIENSNKKDNYTITGKFEWKDDILHITELPIKKWTKDYYDFLAELMGVDTSSAKSKEKEKKEKKDKKKKDDEEEGSNKVEVILEDIRQQHTCNRVHFEIKFLPDYLDKYKDNPDKVIKKFKLQKNLATTNMVCFDKDHKLKRYNNVTEIMEEFYILRLEYYTKRKEYMLSILKRDLEILDNKVRFIILVVDDKLIVRKKKKADLIKEMFKLGFTPMTKINSIKIVSKSEALAPLENLNPEEEEEKDDDGDDLPVKAKEYDYLLSMPLMSLTHEKVNELLNNKEGKVKEITLLEKTETKDMWLNDLTEFLKVLDEVEAKEEEERLGGDKIRKNIGKGKGAAKAKKTKDDSAKKPEKKKTKEATKEIKGEKENKATNDAKETKKEEVKEKEKSTLNPFDEAAKKVATATPVNLDNLSFKERIMLKMNSGESSSKLDNINFHTSNQKRKGMIEEDDQEDLDKLIFGQEVIKKVIPTGGKGGNVKKAANKKSKVIKDDDESDEEFDSTNLDDGRKFKF